MNQQPQKRRDFLRSAVRSTWIGVLGVLGVVLFRRQRNCKTRGGCGGCNLSDGCSLPWKEAKR